MSATALVLVYVAMLAFDVTILGGTVYLIAERAWSPWWMVLAVLIISGSNPRAILEALVGRESGG